jgi:hypothetical protein
MSRFHGLKVRITLGSTVVVGKEKDPKTYYQLVMDPDAKNPGILTAAGSDGKLADFYFPSGITDCDTTETMGGHSASLGMHVSREVGEVVRALARPQDALRIDASQGDPKYRKGKGDGGWFCLFDGFVDSISINKVSMPDSFSWRMQIQASGLQKLIRQSWLNWHMALSPMDDDRVTKPGQLIMDELGAVAVNSPERAMGILFKQGLTNLIEIEVRGTKVAMGEYFQLGSNGGGPDFQSEPKYKLGMTTGKEWYYRAQGSFWDLVSGISEPGLHELFVTYRQRAFVDDAPEIPTVIYRAHPYPGKAGDDDNWNGLDVVRVGLDDGTEVLQIQEQRSDAGFSNAFHWAPQTAKDSKNAEFFGKTNVGFLVDTESIKKYGFRSATVSTSMVSMSSVGSTDWITSVPMLMMERAAYQTVPLPHLLSQQRAYTCLPGIHIGVILEDHTGENVTTGYVTGVSHTIQADPFHVSTMLTVTRCLEGIDAEGYPDAVREFCKLETRRYIKTAEQAIAEGVDVSPSAPGGAITSKAPPIANLPTPIGNQVSGAPRPGAPPHKGQDFGLSSGTALKAPIAGNVDRVRWQPKGAGWCLDWVGADGSKHTWGHLSSHPPVVDGEGFKLGDVIAYSGNTGEKSRGAHLHWQMTLGGNAIDPTDWLKKA